MNKDEDKLDILFRKGLEDPVDHASYSETDWGSLEQMLDKHKKRRGIIYWLPVLSGAAALLLLFLGWWIFVQKTPEHHQARNQAANHIKPTNTVTNNVPTPQPDHQQTLPNSAHYVDPNYVNIDNRKKAGNSSKSSFILSAASAHRDSASSDRNDAVNMQFAEELTAVSYLTVAGPASITAPPVNSIDIPRPAIDQVTDSAPSKNKIKLQSAYRPQFALSVLGAPDINGVGSFQQSKLGTNVGMLFSAGVSKKFTISTGVIYADKPYLTDFANYHTAYKFPTSPVNVTADCRMLDIPLNLGYQIYNKRQNKVSIGTGLSSYIMLHQNFTFNYSNPYTVGPSRFDVSGNDKYLFSVLNLNATYQRQLNSKVGLSVQPYLKLPMTNIGYSQVRLQTTGVAVGLNWNLNSVAKH